MTELTPEQQNAEDTILALRYAYYVECDPIMPDAVYDKLERDVRALLPDTSPVHRVGSDLASSYPQRVIDAASELRSAKS